MPSEPERWLKSWEMTSKRAQAKEATEVRQKAVSLLFFSEA
jgi:P2-related tail formation protein